MWIGTGICNTQFFVLFSLSKNGDDMLRLSISAYDHIWNSVPMGLYLSLQYGTCRSSQWDPWWDN